MTLKSTSSSQTLEKLFPIFPEIEHEKPASEIRLSNIIYAVNEEVKTLNCKKNSKRGCNNKSYKCITHNLWDQLDQHINGFFEKVKLQDLTRNN